MSLNTCVLCRLPDYVCDQEYKMQLVLKYFIIFVFYLAFLDGVRFRCDYRYTNIGWFKFHTIPATWRNARLQCTLEGGILASPTNAGIQSVMMESTCKDIFTGIHATFSEGQYHTVDGIPLALIPHKWAPFEPDNKNNAENCLAMSSEGKLSDVNCDEPRQYICFREHSNIDVNICGTTDPEYHFESRTNKCYKFHSKARTFARAHFACSSEGGHLVIINSDEEANVIRELFAMYPPDKIMGGHLRDIAFIGFHNWGENSGDWRTIHGQPLQDAGYAKFAKGQPDNGTGGEYCGSVFRSGLLNDLWCENHFAFICEKSPDFPPICDNISVHNEHHHYHTCFGDSQEKQSSTQSNNNLSAGPVF